MRRFSPRALLEHVLGDRQHQKASGQRNGGRRMMRRPPSVERNTPVTSGLFGRFGQWLRRRAVGAWVDLAEQTFVVAERLDFRRGELALAIDRRALGPPALAALGSFRRVDELISHVALLELLRKV